MNYFGPLGLLLAMPFFLMAQASPAPLQHHQDKHHNFRIAAVIGHTYIPSGVAEKYLFIPSWGLDLEWWKGHSFGIGLHHDLELQSFVVRQRNQELLERVHPVVISLDFLYRFYRGFVFQLGPGVELERHHNYVLIRTGLEYEFEFRSQGSKHVLWDISPMLFYDHRIKANDTWSVGLGIGRRF
jgi:hypothetical protein